MVLGFFRTTPVPAGFGKGTIVPEGIAPLLSRVIFHWVNPILSVGNSRPLQQDDLWELPPSELSQSLCDELQERFYARCPPESRPPFLRPPSSSLINELKGVDQDERSTFTKERVEYDSSLVHALHGTFWRSWWLAGFLMLCGNTLQTTSPLVNQVLLKWLVQSYTWYGLTSDQRQEVGLQEPHGIGYGIGLAFALFFMQEAASVFTNHSMQISMRIGMQLRTAVIGSIFRKSLRLSGKARIDHSVGKITTLISTDAARFDVFAWLGHHLWVGPIQISIGLALIIKNLGYSALVSLAVLLIGIPVQGVLAQVLFKQRQKGVKFTDARVRLTSELLQGIRLLKLYGWEEFYVNRIQKIRNNEMRTVWIGGVAMAGLAAFMICLPTIATIMSFITYSLTKHNLSVAVIFTCLQLFNVMRGPLNAFPMALLFTADSMVALKRVSTFLTASELEEPFLLNPNITNDIEMDGDFTWETIGKVIDSVPVDETPMQKALREKKEKDETERLKNIEKEENGKAHNEQDQPLDKPFMLKNLKLSIAPGSFVAIVGAIGSGKSSILQAMIGEMRKTRGDVVFRRSVCYVPQLPWIQSVNVRDNIIFGAPFHENRYQDIIDTCVLGPDLEILPDGDRTEIGERGITLSGGQKARISLARAAYSLADIVLLDDPLSAVDAHVGNDLVNRCLLAGPLSQRTRVLATHSLRILSKVDYIFVVDEGQIKEQGRYLDLMAHGSVLPRLMSENSGQKDANTKVSDSQVKEKADSNFQEAPVIMQLEERFTGAVPWATYKKYFEYAGGMWWIPVVVFFLILYECCQVASTLWLGFWSDGTILGFKQGHYMAVYGALAGLQALFSFLSSLSFSLVGLFSAFRIFRTALENVLASPVSFFDTTPIGRIHSRLSKDQDTIDNELSLYFVQLSIIFSSIFGTIGLVFYTFPYLGILFVPMTIIYYVVGRYYRRTSVETKRLDALLRSALYTSVTETLTGLPTIRIFGQQMRAIHKVEESMDKQNRAYYMTVSIQQWLGVRLDLFGNILVLGITLFAAGFRKSVSPGTIGVVLSYTLGVTQVFSSVVTMFASVEQGMNAVERMLVYTDLSPQPSTVSGSDKHPPTDWPDKGHIIFSDVDLSYREGLPMVLKGVSLDIMPGEKVGVVGRTGAGKSSLLQALFRVVELRRGVIEIDGLDIAEIPLSDLRRRLALVPQETSLFSGTLRENLDPEGNHTDDALFFALQRAGLLETEEKASKFRLDSPIGDDGSNFSVGERQLLALCRAMVKNSNIIILDEATSSVDVETDARIQRAIQKEFSKSTLICIAHRLHTIAYYDRVVVMDQGCVAEFDAVLDLYDREGSTFRGLCDDGHLSRADILKIREAYNNEDSDLNHSNAETD